MITIEENKNKNVPGMSSLYVKFKYNPDIINILKTLPTYSYDKKNYTWEIPISSLSELIVKLSPYDDIELKTFEYKPKTITKYELSEYKLKPFPYQEEGIQYGLNNNKWLLLDKPGLGKTPQIIHVAEELKKAGKIEHCLIICGINTLKFNWEKEIAKHSDLTSMILGKRINRNGNTVFESIPYRVDQLKNKIDEFFIITNVETLRDERIVKALLNGGNNIDMMVVDEAHVLKSPTSQQSKNLLKLKSPKYKIAATGTLIPNNPLDAYVPLKWIGAESASYTNFRYYYCKYGGQFGNEFIGFRNLDTLKYMLSHYSLRRDKSLLNLPPKTIINEYIEMDPKQEHFYTNITKGIKDEVDKVELNNKTLLGMVTRLRQATACPSILTTENIPSSKMERCIDLVEQILSEDDKVVIFSTFKETVYELQNALSKYNPLIGTGDIDDDKISQNVDKFQTDPNNKVFIGTWQKCGTGLTLTAANYMIFIDTPWTDASFEQACDRIHRISTSKPVTIYTLITSGTIDERVLEIVEDKEALSSYIIDDEITEKGLNSLKKYVTELK